MLLPDLWSSQIKWTLAVSSSFECTPRAFWRSRVVSGALPGCLALCREL